MHTDHTADLLRSLGSKLEAGETVVEQGVWLGASLAEVLSTAPQGVHAHGYDRFRASAEEVGKARDQGLELQEGQDTLPVVRKLLPDPRVEWHKVRDLRQSTDYRGPPVALYIDDANKSKEGFSTAMRRFMPWFIPGHTKLFLMDYWFFLKRPDRPDLKYQKQWIEGNPAFALLESAMPHDSGQLVLFKG